MRIVWAIAAKDIVDALRNKTIVSSFITVLFLVALYSWLPGLIKPGRTDLVIFDTGNSRLSQVLQENPNYRVHHVSSLEEFKEWMDDADSGELGLIIPVGFDAALEAGDVGDIDAYVLWNRRANGDELKANLERQIEDMLGQPIRISLVGTVVPGTDAMGSIRIVALTLVIPVFFLGAFTIPNLMFEEKQTKTIEQLLLSPASVSQLVLGKALAGLFYCTTAFVVLFLLHRAYVVSWGLAISAVALITLFAVSLGLVLGTFLDRKQQLGSWVLILAQPLLIPVFLSAIDPIFPEAVREVLAWMPMVAQTLLFRYAFTDGATPTQIMTAISITTVSIALMLGLVIWKVRRMDS
jgi:ABC-2 type transport system permease protein